MIVLKAFYKMPLKSSFLEPLPHFQVRMSKILIRFARAEACVNNEVHVVACMSPQTAAKASADITTEPRKQIVTHDAFPATCDGCGWG